MCPSMLARDGTEVTALDRDDTEEEVVEAEFPTIGISVPEGEAKGDAPPEEPPLPSCAARAGPIEGRLLPHPIMDDKDNDSEELAPRHFRKRSILNLEGDGG